MPKPVYLYDCYANCIPSYCYGCNLFDTPQVEDGGIIKEHYTKVGDSYKTYSEVCEAVEKYNKRMGLTVDPKTGITFQDIKPPNEVYEDTVYCREKIATQTKKENQKKWEEKLAAHGELLKKGMYDNGDTGKAPVKDASRSDPAPTPPGFEVPAGLGAAGIAAYFAAKHRKKE